MRNLFKKFGFYLLEVVSGVVVMLLITVSLVLTSIPAVVVGGLWGLFGGMVATTFAEWFDKSKWLGLAFYILPQLLFVAYFFVFTV